MADNVFGGLFDENIPAKEVQEMTEEEKKNKFSAEDIKNIEIRTLSTLGVLFILDHSKSMAIENRVGQVNEGLRLFIENLKDTEKRGEVAFDVGVVAMGGSDARYIRELKGLELWKDLTLVAEGVTPLVNAINIASEKINDRMSFYETDGKGYKKPWVIIMSDGIPTDENGYALNMNDDRILQAKKNLRETGCLVYTFYIGDTTGPEAEEAKDVLRMLATRNDPKDESKGRMSYVLSEKKDSIKDLFKFLSNTVDVKSHEIYENTGKNVDGGFDALFTTNK